MPTELEELYYSEKFNQIRELFLEGNYQAGIIEAVTLKNNLFGEIERKEYYCRICKLLALGYRKLGKTDKALSVLREADRFADNMLKKTNDDNWFVERAIISANMGAVYYSIGSYQKALQAFLSAKPVFEEKHDNKHLFLLYHSVAEIYTALGDEQSAEEALSTLRNLQA